VPAIGGIRPAADAVLLDIVLSRAARPDEQFDTLPHRDESMAWCAGFDGGMTE
jgi:hypothetical protein